MESKGFDGNECFIRVYIEEEHVPALRAAAEKAMALYHKGGITPNSSTGPELVLPDDLLKVMKWFVIDGMHRVTALQQLIAAHSDDKEKYRMVRAVLYLPSVIPHAVALAKACNKQTACSYRRIAWRRYRLSRVCCLALSSSTIVVTLSKCSRNWVKDISSSPSPRRRRKG